MCQNSMEWKYRNLCFLLFIAEAVKSFRFAFFCREGCEKTNLLGIGLCRWSEASKYFLSFHRQYQMSTDRTLSILDMIFIFMLDSIRYKRYSKKLSFDGQMLKVTSTKKFTHCRSWIVASVIWGRVLAKIGGHPLNWIVFYRNKNGKMESFVVWWHK